MSDTRRKVPKPVTRRLPDGSLVCRSPKYAKRDDLPDDVDHQALVIGLHDCMDTPPKPEFSRNFPDLTGRYEGNWSLLCLNQAGTHIEIWFSFRSKRGGGPREASHYGGDFVPRDKRFELYVAPKREDVVGWLTSNDETGSLEIEFKEASGGGKDTLDRYSTRATLSDRAVEEFRRQGFGKRAEAAERILDAEHVPVNPRDYAQVIDGLRSHEFRTRLQTLFSVEPEHSNKNNTLIANQILRKIYPLLDRLVTDLFSESDRPKVRAFLRSFLMTEPLKLRSPDNVLQEYSLYEWLQRVRYYARHFTLADIGAGPLVRWYGVHDSDVHRYELDVDLNVVIVEAGIPFGRWVEKAKKKVEKAVEKLDPAIRHQAKKYLNGQITKYATGHAGGKYFAGVLRVQSEVPQPVWEQVYLLDFWVASLGLAGGMTLDRDTYAAKGWTETQVEWRPRDFVGPVSVLPGLASDHAKTNRSGPHQLMLIAEGSGNDASIQLVFDRDIKTGMTRSDIGWGHGWIQEEEGFEIEPSRPKRARIVKYDKEYEREDSASFQLSSATIRHDGRQDLRIFAANELALLRDPDARLDITGFADRLGGRWYNDVLSLARANNALQALQDCTGGIGATANTKGHGERHLAALGDAMGFPDSSASPEWRRVFLVLNGVASISLRVIDLEDEP